VLLDFAVDSQAHRLRSIARSIEHREKSKEHRAEGIAQNLG